VTQAIHDATEAVQAEQDLYDAETDHGADAAAQRVWNAKIASQARSR
jgi:hypothetical protein